MEGAGGPATHPLEQELEESPFAFDFFQAARRIECEMGNGPGFGNSDHPGQDPVRICQATSIAFAPTAIREYVPAGETSPARLFVSFMGMLGTNGPMPLSVTEYIYDRIHNLKDSTFARFLDVFNHRMISLFYRAWANSHQVVSRDREGISGYDAYVGSAFGMGTAAMRNADTFPDEAKLHFAGHLSCQTKHAEGLEALVGEYFGVKAEVVEYVGRWLPVPSECLCLLGTDSAVLGKSAIAGSHMWECQQKYRLRLGPMGFEPFERLLAHMPGFRRLIDAVRNYMGDQLLWDCQLILLAAEVPRIQLGRAGRLGWTTWLGERSSTDDADDLVVHESRIEMIKNSMGRETTDGRD